MVKTVGAKDTKQRNRSTKAQMEMKRLKDKGFATTRQGFMGLFQAAQLTEEAAGPSEGSSSTPEGGPEGEVTQRVEEDAERVSAPAEEMGEGVESEGDREENIYYDDDVDADADDNDDDTEDKDDVIARGSALMRNVCGVVQERLRAELSSKSHKGSDAWLKKELLKHPVPHPDFLMDIRVWIPDEEFKVEMDMVCPEGHPGVTKWGFREKKRASTMMIGLTRNWYCVTRRYKCSDCEALFQKGKSAAIVKYVQEHPGTRVELKRWLRNEAAKRALKEHEVPIQELFDLMKPSPVRAETSSESHTRPPWPPLVGSRRSLPPPPRVEHQGAKFPNLAAGLFVGLLSCVGASPGEEESGDKDAGESQDEMRKGSQHGQQHYDGAPEKTERRRFCVVCRVHGQPDDAANTCVGNGGGQAAGSHHGYGDGDVGGDHHQARDGDGSDSDVDRSDSHGESTYDEGPRHTQFRGLKAMLKRRREEEQRLAKQRLAEEQLAESGQEVQGTDGMRKRHHKDAVVPQSDSRLRTTRSADNYQPPQTRAMLALQKNAADFKGAVMAAPESSVGRDVVQHLQRQHHSVRPGRRDFFQAMPEAGGTRSGARFATEGARYQRLPWPLPSQCIAWSNPLYDSVVIDSAVPLTLSKCEAITRRWILAQDPTQTMGSQMAMG
ncbi:hypothetical protein AB1Y20_003814 [Prymnesium parvum]|uniref:Uncharacterized protein n=1 Tax=Prymnesium parvum TaxID=97485 RepID=A0AB34J8T3_PRYPA